jgi:uncharacterized protein
VALIVDSSGLLAAIDDKQEDHVAAKHAVESALGPLLLSPFVLAELDYMVLTRYGREQELALLGEVGRGAYRLERFSSEDVARAREVVTQYGGLRELGLADASNVVLAERYNVRDILTLDERDFRVLQGPQGPFRLLPADL